MKHFNLSSWAVSHPTLILFLMIVLGAAGFFSAVDMELAASAALAGQPRRIRSSEDRMHPH